VDTFIDVLVYTMNCMLEKEHGSVHGLGVIAIMMGWKMENFSVPYWHKFLITLQGYHVPTRISLFLIVNPPCWFGSIWKIMKTMMSEDFRKKVAVIGFDELSRYLMDGCCHHLPDDLEGGKLNMDTLVKAFIVERKAIESKPL
jgi:CRAL/TRIO domain